MQGIQDIHTEEKCGVMSQTNPRPAAGRLPHKTAVKPPPPQNLNEINNLCSPLPWLLLCLVLLTGPAPVAAQTVTARLSVDVLSLDEGDAPTALIVTASLSQAASAATTVTLALPTTRPTSPFLLSGLTVATQGASNDYTTTFDATTHTITIAANQTSGTTTFNIDPSTDTATEGTETIIITGTGTGLNVLPTEVYLEDGPYVAFPSMVDTHIYYHSASVSIVVPAVTGAVGTVTYSLTGTAEDVTAAPNLTFTASSRTLAGTAHSADARTRYTITATDDMGTTTGTNPTADDKTATTIVSVIVIQDQCSTPTGWHPSGVTTPSAALIKDCNILLAAKASFVANNSTYTLDWATTASMDDWNYIELDSNRIDRLFVDQESYAKGPTPPALGGLTALEELTFSGTKDLDGTIPPELGSLSTLKWLTLYDNKLTGPVPRELGGLVNLIVLDLGTNQLSGSLPAELGQLAKLLDFGLPDNQLSGSLPWELGKLSKLETFLLYGNTLSGVIPPRLDKLTDLKTLTLYDNDFTGSLPRRWKPLTKLERLSLYKNNLSGTLPAELGTLTSLKYVYLQDNQLSGAIPAELGTMTGLKHLDLQNNNLSGTIPPSLGNLGKDGTTRNLTWLLLSGNQLTGSIPKELNKLAGLQALYLHDNLLTGPIPSEFGANTNLDSLTFFFDYNESVCLPTTLKQWYGSLGKDTVEVHCAFDTPAAPTTVTPGPASLAVEWGAYTSTHTAPPTFTLSDYQFQRRAGTTGQMADRCPNQNRAGHHDHPHQAAPGPGPTRFATAPERPTPTIRTASTAPSGLRPPLPPPPYRRSHSPSTMPGPPPPWPSTSGRTSGGTRAARPTRPAPQSAPPG